MPAPGADGPVDQGLGTSDPESVARTILLQRLTRSAATRSQLAELLARRGVPVEAADRVLDRFCDVGLIDDGRFAMEWVESRHAGRGLARRALAHELRGKGVSPATIAAALDDLDPEVERETAQRLAVQRLRSLRGQPVEVQRRRLAGFLARKGYAAGLVYEVVGSVIAEEAAEAQV
jgi:regulatory protein